MKSWKNNEDGAFCFIQDEIKIYDLFEIRALLSKQTP